MSAAGLAARAGAAGRRLAARAVVARSLDLHVEGLEHVPASGPAILVARHYHHLFDAAAILTSVPREVHVLVALDWLRGGPRLSAMRWLAGVARWPGVWRSGHGWGRNREGYRLSLDLLREGHVLLVFPEGYPYIDPEVRPGSRRDAFLPFQPGFLVLAQRSGLAVPLVPVGLWYAPRPGGGWSVWLRFGPVQREACWGPRQRHARLASLETEVRRLSAAPTRP